MPQVFAVISGMEGKAKAFYRTDFTPPFFGPQMMCLIYAWFKCIALAMDSGMDLDEPFLSALQLFEAKEQGLDFSVPDSKPTISL